ncbi:MAG: COG3014 family protein [Spirochaetota bacterium]
MMCKKTMFAVLLVAGIVSCGKDYATRIGESESAFYGGEYAKAADIALARAKDGGNDRLLYLMEAGLMLHTAGDYRKSNEVLFAAADLAEELKISLTKQTASLLLNEQSTNYRGENFEHVLIHMYLGLNFFMLDDFESARVEFLKISRMLEDIEDRGGPEYEQNVMARYLTALCYEAIGDTDNDFQAHEFAYIEYRKIYDLKPSLPFIQRDLVRLARKLGDDEELSRWNETFGRLDTVSHTDTGELVLIHQAGRGASKVSRGKLLNDSGMKTTIVISLNSMSLQEGVTVAAILVALQNIEHPIPDYKKPDNRIDHIRVRLADTSQTVYTTMLENIVSTAELSAEKTYEVTRKKVAAGIAVKAVATYASAVAAEKIAENTQLKDASKLIGFLTGAAVGTTLASQIRPDLRCWHTLPANLQIARLPLPAGTYEVLIDHVDKNGSVYRTEKESFTIKKGERTVMNYRTLR